MKIKQRIFTAVILALLFSGTVKASVLCVFEDDPNFLIKYKQGGSDFSGELVIDANNNYTGHSSILVTPNQFLSTGFVIPIRQNPGEGEYRYLTMAWKKQGGNHLIIQFHGEYNGQKKMQVYHAGLPAWTPTRELAAVPPTEWTAYEGTDAIDLYKDLADCNITAIVLSPLDGEYAQFDHIYFTGTLEEAKSLVQPAAFIHRAVGDLKGKVKDIQNKLADIEVHSSLWKKLQKQAAKLLDNLNEMYAAVEQKDFKLSQKEVEDIDKQLTKYSEQIEKELSPAVYKAVLADHMQKQYNVKDAEYGVLVGSTMQKFFKDERPDLKELCKVADISLAQNEYEGFQLLLMPITSDLEEVKIYASDLRQGRGKGVISAENIQISLVGYVETQKPQYPIHPQRIGWWPDPLLTNKPFKVLANEIQPVWITVYASENTPAGQYDGQIIIECKNARSLKVPINITVWDFTLPVTPTLKTAFTFSECMVEQWYMTQLPEDARRAWYRFILKHKLNPQTLYPSNEANWSYRNLFRPMTWIPFEEGIIPRKKDMEFCMEHGMNLFNVGVGYPEIARQEKLSDFNKKLEEHLKSYTAYLAEKGWSDKGFLYVFDEIFTRDEEDLRRVRDFLAKLKVFAPDFKRAATLQIDKDRIDKMAGYLDIYIPLSSHYNEELFSRIKQQGAEAWWYVCNVPTAPWPTFSPIESPALDARIFFWMNWKYQVPGVLYHNLNWWGENIRRGGKERWPEIPWVPQEVPEFNGDGYLIYPGEKIDTPLSSIRLENIRDGIEDYEYFSLLKERIETFRSAGGDQETIITIEKLLTVDDSIARNQTERTNRPSVLLKRRAKLAEAIEKLGASIHKLQQVETKSGQLILIRNGESDYRIVISAGATEKEKRAAAELQQFLKQISTAEIPIVTDDRAASSPEIVLGKSARLSQMKADVDFAKLGEDGFVIKTLGQNLIIAGGSGRATLYGVYDFLENYLGCRWYAPKVSYIPKKTEIVLNQIDDLRIPTFSLFRSAGGTDEEDTDLPLRLKLSGPIKDICLTKVYETGSVGEVSFPNYGPWLCHGVYKLIPPSKYFKDHPEYFSLIDGQRRHEYKNQPAGLCFTNPGMFKAMVEELRQYMSQYPDAKIWDVSPDDYPHHCQCDNCMALEKQEETPMGPLLALVNKLAAEFPDKTISTLAYSFYIKAPKTLRPASNVLITFCPLNDKRGTLSESGFQKSEMENFEKWSQLHKNLFVMQYYSAYNHSLMPNPIFKIIQSDIQYYAKHGVTGFLPCTVMERGSEFQDLKKYLIAKLLWNPDADLDKLMTDFLTGYYGKAAGPIHDYINLMHTASEQSGLFLPLFARLSEYREGYLSPSLVDQYNRLFCQAEEMVADNQEVLRRVQVAHLQVMFAQLELGYGDVDERLGVAKRFFQIAERERVVQFGERRSLPRYRNLIMAKLEKEKDLLAKKVSEAEKGSLEIILPEPMQADRLVLELMEDGDRISRYTIEGLVDRNWQTLSSGTRIGYRVVQPLMEASAPEQGISDWTKTDLPHPPVPKEYYWAGFPVNEPPREINSEGWYRKQFTIPSEWEGKDLVLQVGQDGVLVDNDVIGAVYFNGSRVGNSWAMAWKDGYGCISGTWPVAKASLYAGSPPAGGAWFKPRHYYVPHWLVRSGVDNYITVWVSDVGGQSGIYEGPIFVVSTEDKKIDLDGVWQMQTLYAAGEKSVMVSKIRLECLSELKPQIKKIAVYTKSTNSKKTVVFRR